MKNHIVKSLCIILLLFLSNPACSGTVILGLNLEFIDSRFNDEGFDGGFGIHAGYEFKEWKGWRFGGLFEFMNGWNNEDDLTSAGEMMYESKSLFVTARPNNWIIMLKAGVVDADYKILEETLTQNFREASGTGYAYGIALVLGGDTLRLELLDYKRVKIGNESFDSIGISLGILFGPGGIK